MHAAATRRIGLSAAIAAYLLWGVLPIFWKQMQHVPALEILAHRTWWSFVVLLLFQWPRGELASFTQAFRNRRVFWTSTCSTLLIAANWFIFVWAVNNGRILETSFGYFINPLMYVLLGTLFLGERLRTVQTISVLMAALGVLYLGLRMGSLPWVSLALAFSFGFYGFVRKLAPMGTLQGLTIETFWLSIPALFYILHLQGRGTGHLFQDTSTAILLISSGAVTVLPLIFFNVGVRRIPLSTMGFCQYLAPSGTFLIGTLVYREPFDQHKLVAFGAVWLGLILFSLDSLRNAHRARIASVAAAASKPVEDFS